MAVGLCVCVCGGWHMHPSPLDGTRWSSELPFKTLFWAGEMAESVKRVHYKHEYLSLVSRTHIKSQACTYNPSTKETEMRILGAH